MYTYPYLKRAIKSRNMTISVAFPVKSNSCNEIVAKVLRVHSSFLPHNIEKKKHVTPMLPQAK